MRGARLLLAMVTVWLLCALGAAADPVPPVKFPPGPELPLLQQRCLVCHGGELIAGQRLESARWEKELTKMTGWGARLSADEQKRLAAYLSKHFGPDTAPATPRRVHLEIPR